MTIDRKKILVILIHVISWLVFMLLPKFIFDISYTEETKELIFFFLIRIFLLAILFYSNIFILIPRFLTKRKILLYLASVIIFVSVILIINHNIKKTFKLYNNKAKTEEYIQESLKHSDTPPWKRSNDIGFLFTSIFILALSTSIKVTQESYNNEKLKKEIQTEKLNSELSFLKSQVNPHFLFNTLNNIYSLANKKSEHTATAVVKLSHLMRYMLYDANKEFCDLKNEIDYLIDYIELQKLRIQDKSKVVFTISGNENNKKIEPLLLVPFIENAFKHGDLLSENSGINIYLQISERELLLKVENHICEIKDNKNISSGIGLYNIKKRLALLYPENHELFTGEINNKYTSILKLNFKDELHSS